MCTDAMRRCTLASWRREFYGRKVRTMWPIPLIAAQFGPIEEIVTPASRKYSSINANVRSYIPRGQPVLSRPWLLPCDQSCGFAN